MRLKSVDHRNLPRGCRVAVYGAGLRGRRTCKAIRKNRPDVEVNCFLDSHKEGETLGLPRLRPEKMPDVDLVLVASTFLTDIQLRLHDLGVPDSKVAIYPLHADFFPRQAMVSHEHGFVFVPACKIAHTSFQKAFAPFCPDGLVNIDFTEPRYDGYFTFAFTRDPYRRILSMFHDKSARGNYARFFDLLTDGRPDFGNTIRALLRTAPGACDPHWMPQSMSFCRADDTPVVDRLYRLENLSEALERLSERFRARVQMPHLNKSAGSARRHVMSAEEKALVAEYYARDFRNFGYDI